jgi:hypothetical protein
VIAPAAVATPAPQRELVYSFTFQVDKNYAAEKAYGVEKMDPGGGGTFMFHNVNQHYIAPTNGADLQRRDGTLKIDVVRREADGGLVLSISEKTDAGYGAPVSCVAYGDTTFICDPNANAGPEVTALGALLGDGFLDPAKLDDNRHWKVVPQGSYGTTADYTIVKNDGSLLDIAVTGNRTAENPNEKASLDGKIEYDPKRGLPTRYELTTAARKLDGAVYVNSSTFTSFTLQTATP